jgi:hypothetical protein
VFDSEKYCAGADLAVEREYFSLISTGAESGFIYMKQPNIPAIKALLIQQEELIANRTRHLRKVEHFSAAGLGF